jgi:hypothetical protein
MTKKIIQTNEPAVASKQDTQELACINKAFSSKMLRLNALACNNIKQEGFNLNDAQTESQNNLIALQANGGLQEMLVAQMFSIHDLQQTSMAMANASDSIATKQYFTNAAIKLANSFTQQAALLAKLQGIGGQKIVVEHVEVHNGGQAIVGNISKGNPN